MFRFRFRVRKLTLHVLFPLCACAVSSSLGSVRFCLLSFLISCMFVSCFAHLSCQFVLTPPILLSDYWLICPNCLSSLPSSFAPFIISLCLQAGASSSSMLPFECILFLPCLALSSLAGCLVFVLFFTNKVHSPAPLSPCFIPNPDKNML